jgi:hypothetical protein
MGEHDCSHLIVIEPDSGRPLGVVSSLDVARASCGAHDRQAQYRLRSYPFATTDFLDCQNQHTTIT